ncbi:MAG: arsenate reductase [Acidobacteriota bacterium]|nr:arsenate reductase [Acidobacteriota bacterium]
MDRLLRESGIDYEKINYFVEPLGEDKLRDLISKMQIAPRELLWTNEPAYRELKLGQRTLTDEEIIRLLVEYPELLQRPIVERGARAVLARPAERVKEVLSTEY